MRERLVAGWGHASAADADELLAALAAALAQCGRAAADLAAVAVPEGKGGVAASAARRLGLPLVVVPAAALRAVEGRLLTRSEASAAATGSPSASEAAALAAGGAGAVLLGPRARSGRATCALAAVRGARVYFIGAGPGAADLITVRGRDLLARCPVCLYAGSIVPAALLAHCPPRARKIDTAPMSLDGIEAEFLRAHAAGEDVARLHSGDTSVWSALAEQARRLDRHGIAWEICPGVPSFAAAAAALGLELTVPGRAQSLVLTRVGGRASPMPDGETLAAFAATGAPLAIHLAIHAIGRVVEELAPILGEGCPCIVVARVSWPDERVVAATLGTIAARLAAEPIERTALILVGRSLGAEGRESALYDAAYVRRFRAPP